MQTRGAPSSAPPAAAAAEGEGDAPAPGEASEWAATAAVGAPKATRRPAGRSDSELPPPVWCVLKRCVARAIQERSAPTVSGRSAARASAAQRRHTHARASRPARAAPLRSVRHTRTCRARSSSHHRDTMQRHPIIATKRRWRSLGRGEGVHERDRSVWRWMDSSAFGLLPELALLRLSEARACAIVCHAIYVDSTFC